MGFIHPPEFTLYHLKKREQRRGRVPLWEPWSDEKLLDMRMCDLAVEIDGTGLEPYIEQLYQELEAKGIRFRPHFWLSYEWFVPDGVPGIAIPFYLAHPSLARLELNQMLEIEGGNPEECMKIMRHEAGHAFENAYALRRVKSLQTLFGPSTRTKYPTHYFPKPYSRSFVRHIEPFYAQSHPDEDFAETFAVWLTPDSNWQKKYRTWPVFEKLQYMDKLIKSLGIQQPIIKSHRQVDSLSKIRKTLRQHYRKRRKHFGLEHSPYYDHDLLRLFSLDRSSPDSFFAADFLQTIRREARKKVAEWTGEYQYLIDRVIKEMVQRCEELSLYVSVSPTQLKWDFMIVLTVQTMNCIHSGRHRVAL